MDIKQQNDDEYGMFYFEENGKKLAKMTYVWGGDDRIIIDHTEVDKSLAGKGIGKQLVAKSVEYARAKNIKIIPLCPFAKSVFEKVKEYQGVL